MVWRQNMQEVPQKTVISCSRADSWLPSGANNEPGGGQGSCSERMTWEGWVHWEEAGQLTATEIFSWGILTTRRSDIKIVLTVNRKAGEEFQILPSPHALLRCILSQNDSKGYMHLRRFFFVASSPIHSLILSLNKLHWSPRQDSKDWRTHWSLWKSPWL